MKKLSTLMLIASLTACSPGGDAPVTSTPAPVTSTPAPVTSTPAPVTSTPAPVTIQPSVPLAQAIAWVDAVHHIEDIAFLANLSALKSRCAAMGLYNSGYFLSEYSKLYVAHEQHFVNEVVAYSANMNLPVRVEIASHLSEIGVSDVLRLADNLDQMVQQPASAKSWIMDNYGPMIANLFVVAISNIQ